MRAVTGRRVVLLEPGIPVELVLEGIPADVREVLEAELPIWQLALRLQPASAEVHAPRVPRGLVHRFPPWAHLREEGGVTLSAPAVGRYHLEVALQPRGTTSARRSLTILMPSPPVVIDVEAAGGSARVSLHDGTWRDVRQVLGL